MESFLFDNLFWIIAITGYFFLLVFTLVISIRLDKYGIRANAKVISIDSESSSEISTIDGEYESLSEDKITLIEFIHEKELIQVKMQVEGRLVKKKINSYIPIIYHKSKSRNPIVDNTMTIYKAPISLSVILIICLIIIFITTNLS